MYSTWLNVDLSTSARADFLRKCSGKQQKTDTCFWIREPYLFIQLQQLSFLRQAVSFFYLSRLCWQQTLVTMEIRLVVSAVSLSWESRTTGTSLSACAQNNDWWTVTQSPWQTSASTALSFGTITIVMQKPPLRLPAAGREILLLPVVDIQIKIIMR